MKFTAIFALFFLLPIVYGDGWWNDFGKDYMKKMPDVQKYIERFQDGKKQWGDAFKKNMEEMGNKREELMGNVGSHWDNMKNKGNDYHKNMKDMLKDNTEKMSEKFGEHWNKMKNMGEEYGKNFEEKRQQIDDLKEAYKEKLTGMFNQIMENSDDYTKIGQQALDLIKEKFEEYSEKETFDERLDEFQNMINEFVTKANATFQEYIQQVKERLEDPELKERLDNLTAYRDLFIEQFQEQVKMAREFINENLRTPEDRKAFFDNLRKMWEENQEQYKEELKNMTGKLSVMYEAFMEKVQEELESREIEIPTEYRENMGKIAGKLRHMMKKLSSKWQAYMNNNAEEKEVPEKNLIKERYQRKRGGWFKKRLSSIERGE